MAALLTLAETFLPDAVKAVQALLTDFASSSNFEEILSLSFGDHLNPTEVDTLRLAWQIGDFSQVPEIEVRSNTELAGASGAYAASTNRIYLSARLLSNNDLEQIVAVLLEEIGHAIDSDLNGYLDSPGDEGAIFSALVRGEAVSPTAMEALKREDDSIVLTIDGQSIVAEANAALTVDTLDDGDDGDYSEGQLSLREALSLIDEGGTITFNDSLAGQTIVLGGSALTIDQGVTVDGEDRGITISSNGQSRVLTIDDGDNTLEQTVVISGLTITGGSSSDNGGGIFNRENLTLTNSTLSGNSTLNNGGGVANRPNSTATLINSTIHNNVATERGGGVDNLRATLILINSTLSGNSATDDGGGLSSRRVEAQVTLTNSTIVGNSASDDGGGIYNDLGTLTLTNSLISGNESDGDGDNSGTGDEVYSTSSTVTADGNNLFGHSGLTNTEALTNVSAGNSDITATSDGTAPTALTDIVDTTLANNGGATQTHALVVNSPAVNAGDDAQLPLDTTDVDDDGDTTELLPEDQRGLARSADSSVDIGAVESISNIVVDTLEDDDDGDLSAGDISLREALAAIEDGGTITFDDTLAEGTIVLNGAALAIDRAVTVDGEDKGITLSGNSQSRVITINDGDNNSDSSVSLLGMTITDGSDNDGGGIFNRENLTLINSTVSGNSANDDGGGIFNRENLTLTNSTVSGNSANDNGGGIYSRIATLILLNSTVSGNSANLGGGIGIASSSMTLTNSLISGNDANFADEISSRGGGAIDSDGNNLFGHSGLSSNRAFETFTPGNSDITATSDGTNPTALTNILDTTLSDNGGPTQTHNLVLGGPAVDAGNDADLPQDSADIDEDDDLEEQLPEDQRGEARISGNAVDIGAVEATFNNIVVDTLEDIEDGDLSTGDISLREALANIASGGTITFDDSLAGDTIVLGGSALTIDQAVTVDAEDKAITISGNSQSRVFTIDDGDSSSDISVSLSGLTLTDGSISGNGGGIYNRENLTLTNSSISGNSATNDGGGIDNRYSTLSLNNSSISGNSATNDGGGVYNRYSTVSLTNSTVSGNWSTDDGGGIYNRYSTVSLTNSTVSENSATGDGGGIYNRSTSTTTIVNSTISGNSATESGGGIYNRGATTTSINSTFSGNLANENGGGIFSRGSTVNLTNSLISGNDADADGDGNGSGDEINSQSSTVNADANNLFGHDGLTNSEASTGFSLNSIVNSSIVATSDGNNPTTLSNILDTTLSDNGGSTQTHALIAGSPALDAGDNDLLSTEAELGIDVDSDGTLEDSSISVDQRGDSFDRIRNGLVDIGAVEFQNDAPTFTSSSLSTSLLENSPVGTTVGTVSASDSDVDDTLSYAITAGNDSGVFAIDDAIGTLTVADASALDFETTPSFELTVTATDTGGLFATATVSISVQDVADNLVVNTNADESDGSVLDGSVSLRDALSFAEAGGTITFDDNLAGETIVLGGSELIIDQTITLDGGTGITIDANSQSRVFNIDDGDDNNQSVVTLANLTITGGSTAQEGGGIYNRENLSLTNSTVSGNLAREGGGIYTFDSTSTLTNSTVSNNSASADGGGIINYRSTLTLANSTVSGNSTNLVGGGIFNIRSTLTLLSSTLTGNLASDAGGGIFNAYASSTATLFNSLIAGNDADSDESGSGTGDEIFNTGSSQINADANNLFGHSGLTDAEAFSGFTPGNSDITATSDGTTPTALTDILDTTLSDNGGPTQTHALIAGSPAVDAGDNDLLPTEAELGIDVDGDGTIEDSSISVDQRGEGFARIINDSVDIGAVEFDAPDLVAMAFDVVDDHVLLGEATINYTLANTSTQTDASSFDVHIVYSDDAIIDIDEGDEIVGSFTVSSLAAGDELTGSMTITLPTDTLYANALADDLTGQASGYVSSSVEHVGLVIDYSNVVVESNEFNNRNQGLSTDFDDVTYFPWDIDSSGQVTATDTIYAINRLGATTTDSNYDALVDFDGSGVITATDVIASINRLGYSINPDALLS